MIKEYRDLTDTDGDRMKCHYAFPGTYGHECGRPAVSVAVFKSTPSTNSCPSMVTASGLFYTGRCAECATIKGGENSGILRLETVKGQVNEWVPEGWNGTRAEYDTAMELERARLAAMKYDPARRGWFDSREVTA